MRAARKLLEKQDAEIRLQGELLALEREINAGLKRLRDLDAGEREQLLKALESKDKIIAATRATIDELKRQRFGFWKKFKLAITAAAAGIIAGIVIAQ